MPIMTDILTLINQGGGIVSATLLIVYSVFKLLDKETKANRKEKDQTERDIISLMQQKVQVLEDWKTEAELQISTQGRKIETLTTEKSLVVEILQGRDKDSLDYREKGLNAMQEVEVVKELCKTNQELSKNIMQSIEKLYKCIDDHLKQEADCNKLNISK